MKKQISFELLQTSNSMRVSLNYFAILGVNYDTVADLNAHIDEEIDLLFPIFCDSFNFLHINGAPNDFLTQLYFEEEMAELMKGLPRIHDGNHEDVKQLREKYHDVAKIESSEELISLWKKDAELKDQFKGMVYNILKRIIEDPQTAWSDMAKHVICCQVPHETSDTGLYDPRGTYIIQGLENPDCNPTPSDYDDRMDAVAMNAFRDIFLSDSSSYEWDILILTRLVRSSLYRNSNGLLIFGELKDHKDSVHDTEDGTTNYYVLSHQPLLAQAELKIIIEIQKECKIEFHVVNLAYERKFNGVEGFHAHKVPPYYTIFNNHVIDVDFGGIPINQIPIKVLQLPQLQNIKNSDRHDKDEYDDEYEIDSEDYYWNFRGRRRHRDEMVDSFPGDTEHPLDPEYQDYLYDFHYLDSMAEDDILRGWKKNIVRPSPPSLISYLKYKERILDYTLDKIIQMISQNQPINITLIDHPDLVNFFLPLKKFCKQIKNEASHSLLEQLDFELYEGIPISTKDLKFLKDFHRLNDLKLTVFTWDTMQVKDAMVIIDEKKIRLLRVTNFPGLKLPTSIANLDFLNVLDLQNNQLSNLSQLLVSLEHLDILHRIDCQRNLISHIPPIYWNKFREYEFLRGFYRNPVTKFYCMSEYTFESYKEHSKMEDVFSQWKLPDLLDCIQKNTPLTLGDLLYPDLLRYRTDIEQYCKTHPTNVAKDTLLFLAERAALDTISQIIHRPIPYLFENIPDDYEYLFGYQIKNQHITSLFLTHKNIPALPDCIGDLRFLEYLDLYENSLSGLPYTFGQLTSLNHLSLIGNEIAEFPFILFELRLKGAPLNRLDFEGNPFYENDEQQEYETAFYENTFTSLLKKKYKHWTFAQLENKIKTNQSLTQLDFYHPELAKYAEKIEELALQYPTATAQKLVEWVRKISQVPIDRDHNILL